MKLIAIPTRDGMVDDHFGHCATLMLAGNMGMVSYCSYVTTNGLERK